MNASSLKPCHLDRCWQFLNAQSWDFSVTKTELPSNTNWSKSSSYSDVQPTSLLFLWHCVMVLKHFFKGALGSEPHIKCAILLLIEITPCTSQSLMPLGAVHIRQWGWPPDLSLASVWEVTSRLGWVIWGGAQDCLLGSHRWLLDKYNVGSVASGQRSLESLFPEVSGWTSDEQITNQCLLPWHINHRARFPADFHLLILSATENAFSSHGAHDLKGPLWNFLFKIHVPGWVGLGHWMQNLNLDYRIPPMVHCIVAEWWDFQAGSTLKKKPGLRAPGWIQGWIENVLSCF